MSNENAILGQKLCHYFNEGLIEWFVNQGCTLNDIFLSKLKFSLSYWKHADPNCNVDDCLAPLIIA